MAAYMIYLHIYLEMSLLCLIWVGHCSIKIETVTTVLKTRIQYFNHELLSSIVILKPRIRLQRKTDTFLPALIT